MVRLEGGSFAGWVVAGEVGIGAVGAVTVMAVVATGCIAVVEVCMHSAAPKCMKTDSVGRAVEADLLWDCIAVLVVDIVLTVLHIELEGRWAFRCAMRHWRLCALWALVEAEGEGRLVILGRRCRRTRWAQTC